MVKITKYLDPAPGEGNQGGAGGAAGGSGAPIGGAGGSTEPSTPDPAVVEAETKELGELLSKGEDKLTAEEKVKFAALRGKYDVEETDADGKPLTKEAKAEIEKTTKRLAEISAKPEAQRTAEEIKFLSDNTEVKKSIYEQVDELSGMPVEVDYKDVKPDSPEGILLREQTIRAQAQEDFDNDLKEKNPLGYQFLLHLDAGGDPNDFFKMGTDNYLDIALTKEDKATQESIYRRALAIKGNSPEQIDTLVTFAKDKGKLFDMSKVELEGLQRNQEREEQQRATQAAANKRAEKVLVDTFFSNMDKTVEKGIQGVVIPKGERKAFSDFVAQNVTIVNGKLVYARVLDPNNLAEDLAANYFRFKKADLSKIAENKAKDLNTKKIVNKIQYKFIPKAAGAANKNYVALGDL